MSEGTHAAAPAEAGAISEEQLRKAEEFIEAEEGAVNILVSRADMPDDMAYNVVKTIIEKKAELVAVHQEANSFSLENQVPSNSSIPWHPGAVKYFTEHGVKM